MMPIFPLRFSRILFLGVASILISLVACAEDFFQKNVPDFSYVVTNGATKSDGKFSLTTDTTFTLTPQFKGGVKAHSFTFSVANNPGWIER